MNITKKILALVLAVMMILSVTACHPKDEVAIKVGDVEITSALYMYALLEADSAARSEIDAKKASSSSSSTSSSAPTVSEPTNYYKEKIDGKKFSDWVKDTALERCREIAFYEQICKENKLTLDKDKLANIDSMVEMYWNYYGYAALYTPNGVSKETFKRAITNDYLKDEYFFFLYGEGGEKEVADSVLEEKVIKTYLTADVLQATITSSMKEEEKTNLIAKFKDYEKRLKEGDTFEAIYNNYYGYDKESTTSSTTATSSGTSSTTSATTSSDASSVVSTSSNTSSNTSSSEAKEPETYKYPYATVMAAKDSKDSYASDLYDEVKKLENDEIKYIETKEKVTLIVRRDMESDKLRMDELKKTTLWNEKSEEFEKTVDEASKKLSFEENSFATDRFKVKKIVYPTY